MCTVSERGCVYYVNSSPYEKVGGAEVSARLWCDELVEREYKVIWCSPPSREIGKGIDRRDVQTNLSPFFGYKKPDVLAVRSLVQEVAEINPEGIVVGDINHWTIPIVEALLDLSNDQNVNVLLNREIFPIYQDIQIKRVLSNLWLLMRARRVLRKGDPKILAISETMAERALRLGISRSKPRVYVPVSEHQVDTCGFEKRERASDKLRVVSVGRVVPEKGFAEYLAPVARICGKERLPVEFSVVGPLDDLKYARRVRERSGGTIKLTGSRRGRQVCDEYDRADVLAHLVPPTEGFGLVLVEGAIHGLPILATDIPTSVEIFGKSDKPVGKLVSFRRIGDLVNGSVEFIKMCIDKEIKRKEIARFARELGAKFDNKTSIENFLSLIVG